MIKIKLSYVVENENMQLKEVLRGKLNVSNRLLIKLKNSNNIFINSKFAHIHDAIKPGDLVEINIDFDEADDTIPEKIDLDILYEDEYILAVNKPAGVVVHPCSYHPNGTLANGVKHYLNNNKKIRPINRLDRDTSGIVIFAKNEYIQEFFTKIRPYKEYRAIIEGEILPTSGTINAPIARKENSIMERCVSENGQEAITHYETLKTFSEYSLLKINIDTGRTHQIRVHLAYNGHPILGDTLYGNESKLILRQALHAYKLIFEHPILKEKITIVAPLPSDMEKLINQ